MTYVDGNLDPGVGQAQKCGCVIPVNGISKGNIVFMSSSKKDIINVLYIPRFLHINLFKQTGGRRGHDRMVVGFTTTYDEKHYKIVLNLISNF